ncbi:MAG: RNA-guided endonuclease InsQ/TnpB family protein, partial [Candidatus Lutacidiplasmatales archaeon]
NAQQSGELLSDSVLALKAAVIQARSELTRSRQDYARLSLQLADLIGRSGSEDLVVAEDLPTRPEHPVGIDLGVNPVATLSNGERIAPSPLQRESERKLQRAQRTLARRKKGSQRYGRQRRKVARLHARLRRQRRWRSHQLSTEWVRRFDLVAFEDLDASELIEGNRLAKRITEAGWGMLRPLTTYKAAARSQRCVLVPSRGTTQL